MKNFQKTVIASSLLCVTAAAVAADKSPVTANVALTSDYVWRGISQSAEEFALQGGFDYAHNSGFYMGLWGSNVDFEDQTVDGAQLETDIYAGYGFKAGGVDLDVGVLHYAYPGAAGALDYDWTEVYFGGSFGMFSAKFSYTDDFTGPLDESAYYLEAGLNLDLGQGYGLGLHVGKSDGDWFDVVGADYVDYKISLSKEFGGFGFDLSYTDTDLDGANAIKSGAFANDGRLVLTVSKSM